MAVAYPNRKPSITTFPNGKTIALHIKPMLKLGDIKEWVSVRVDTMRHLSGDAERQAFDELYFDSILAICQGWDVITEAGAAMPFTPDNLRAIHQTRRILMCRDLFYHLGIVKQEAAA